ncbi:hypothetical protein JXO59_16760 [candidate division KSB1 bacterium]|nr:hypothetical protein [candidate division KSB1 bacterium]
MTVLIVLAMGITFLLIDYAMQLRQSKAMTYATVPDSTSGSLSDLFLPEGVFVIPGHLWSILLPSGKVKIGIDRLVSNMIGTPDEIIFPQKGTNVKKGDYFLTVKKGKRTLRFAAPIDGVVMDVNETLSNQPAKISAAIEQAWAISLQPSNLSTNLRNWHLGDEAKRWLLHELARMRDFFAPLAAHPALAATLQDGGVPVNGLMHHMDDSHLQRFELEFLTNPIAESGDSV